MKEIFPGGIRTRQGCLKQLQSSTEVRLRLLNASLDQSSQFVCASCLCPLTYVSTHDQEGLLIMKQYRCQCSKVYVMHFARVGIYEQSEDVILMKQCLICARLYPDGDEHFCS